MAGRSVRRCRAPRTARTRAAAKGAGTFDRGVASGRRRSPIRAAAGGGSRMSAPDLRSIVDIAPLVRSRAISPIQLVESCLSAIAAQPEVNAFTTVLEASALDDARRAEAQIAAGGWRGA